MMCKYIVIIVGHQIIVPFYSQSIKSTNHHIVESCFTAMLTHWLKRSDPLPSWSELAEALRSPPVGRPDIAGVAEAQSTKKDLNLIKSS